MANEMATIKVDTSNFDRKMDQYRKITSKTVAEIVNTKDFYIAIHALNQTYHSTRSKIEGQLGRYMEVGYTNKKGKFVKKKKFAAKMSSVKPNVPYIDLLINSRRKKQGLKPLFGKDIIKERAKLYRIKIFSINFLRSGWLAAVNGLKPFAKKDQTVQKDGAVKKVGKYKGWFKAGNPSDIFTSTATIANSAHTDDPKARQIIVAGLQGAIDKETQSMDTYIHNKLKDEWNKGVR